MVDDSPRAKTTRRYHYLSLGGASAFHLEGVGVQHLEQENTVRLDREVFNDQLTELITRLSAGQIGYVTGNNPIALSAEDEPGEEAPVVRMLDATDDDIRIINANHSVKQLKADDVRVYERYVVNDAIARIGIQFTRQSLDVFAANFKQGRSRLMYHNQADVVGRTFSADVVRKKIRGVTANWVRVKEYLLNDDATRPIIAKLDAGILAFDSIGFTGGKYDMQEVKMGSETVPVLLISPQQNSLRPLEAAEVSYVFLGAMYGAGNDVQRNSDKPEGSTVAKSQPNPLAGNSTPTGNQPTNEKALCLSYP